MPEQKKKLFKVFVWMIQDLKLKGNELLLYAMIFDATFSEQKELKETLSNLSSILCISKRNVIEVLNRLLDKGLISKREYYTGSIKRIAYKTK